MKTTVIFLRLAGSRSLENTSVYETFGHVDMWTIVLSSGVPLEELIKMLRLIYRTIRIIVNLFMD